MPRFFDLFIQCVFATAKDELLCIVDILINVMQYSVLFCCIVTKLYPLLLYSLGEIPYFLLNIFEKR